MPNYQDKKIVVLGGGAIGSVVAAAISERWGRRLLLVARKPHVKAVRERGLRLEGKINSVFRPEVAETVAFPLDGCLVILTTKATDVEKALEGIFPLLRPDSYLLLLQNGLGIKEAAVEVLRDSPLTESHILMGIVAVGATFLEPGRVGFYGGNIRLEPGFDSTPFRGLLDDTFIPSKISTSFTKDIWTKLAVNAVVNPLSVLLAAQNRFVADPAHNEIKTLILEEVLAVAAAEGMPLSLDVEFINRFIASDNFTSMYQDIRRRKRTEIDYINGAVVRLAEKHGVETPVNRFLVGLIKAVEKLSAARPEK